MMRTMLRAKQKAATASANSPIAEELPDYGLLGEKTFLEMLRLERKRTERSHQRFALMILGVGGLLRTPAKIDACAKFLVALSESTRDTDIRGWYKEGASIGVIFTDIGLADGKIVASALLKKVTAALAVAFSIEDLKEIRLAFHVYPEDWRGEAGPNGPDALNEFPTLAVTGSPREPLSLSSERWT